jgi:hypothetical protein
MSLSNMKVFNNTLRSVTIELLAQMVDKFNAASGGAIVLTAQGFVGDYLYQNQFSSLASARRRVDRYATNADAAATRLAELQHIGVKVAGGFGPVEFEPGQMTWVQDSPEKAIAVISQALAEGMLQDQLNTVIAALVAAIEAQTTATTYDTATGPISYADLNLAHAKFGDHSGLIIANVLHSQSYHGLIGLNLANTTQLFQAMGVTVVDILGKRVVVTDAPALLETNTGADIKALGLVSNAGTVYDGSDLITNIETTNGKERIVTTFQADYTFGVALKGYAWDTGSGGKSPTDTELATGANWDKVATSIKHTAGVMVLANAP